MNDDDVLVRQRALRRRFFEGPQAVRWRPGRELMAQRLLYLDDTQACGRLTTNWLRQTLDADPVDGGYGGFVTSSWRARLRRDARGAARRPVGMVCADWHRESPRRPGELCLGVGRLMARALGRSLSTVDHPLRSIRQKLGVGSTALLVHLLSEHLDPRAFPRPD